MAADAHRYGVFVGVADYDDPNLFSYKTIGSSLNKIHSFFDKSDLWTECTLVSNPVSADDMMDPIVAAADKCEPGDTLLTYFVGHADSPRRGDQYADVNLALRGSKWGRDWTYLGLQQHLYPELRKARAESRILILDCCYCGRAQSLAGSEPSLETNLVMDEQERTCVLKAVALNDLTQHALSERAEDDNYTAFSGALIDIFTEGIPDLGSPLYVDDVYRELRGRLSYRYPEPELLTKNSGLIILLENNSDRARQSTGRAIGQRLSFLEMEELAAVWAGVAQDPPRASSEEIKKYIAGLVEEEGKIWRIAHWLHEHGGAEPQHDQLLALVLDVLDRSPSVVGQVCRAFRTAGCGRCGQVAGKLSDGAYARLSPAGIAEFHRASRG